jgi:hypothetical protein
MTTVNEQLNEVTKQKNTLSFIMQSITRLDLEQMRLITDNTFNIDKVRIENIKDFLTLQKTEVEDLIEDLLQSGVSGV